jgi:hypothetical protein
MCDADRSQSVLELLYSSVEEECTVAFFLQVDILCSARTKIGCLDLSSYLAL